MKLSIILIVAISIFQNALATPFKPPCFTENRGQWPSSVRFMAEPGGQAVWITDSALVTDYYQIGPDSMRHGQVIGMNYADYSKNISYATGAPIDYFESFFSGDGIIKARCYSEIVAENVWPGIDVRYYYQGQRLRYDFIVNPGADPEQVQLDFRGQHALSAEGRQISLKTRFSDIVHGGLYAYEKEINNQVNCRFECRGRRISFSAEHYSPENTLVIDPVVTCRVLYSDTESLVGAVQRDRQNNKYFVSRGLESVYPPTDSTYDSTAQWVHFFVKTDQDFERVYYCIKRPKVNFPTGSIYLVPDGTFFLVARANRSSKEPAPEGNAYQKYKMNEIASKHDIYIAKIDSGFSKIYASTYLGSYGDDRTKGVLINSKGEPIIVLQTDSTCFPGVDQSMADENFGIRIVVAKMSADLTELKFASYLGQGHLDYVGTNILLDRNDNLVFSGATHSPGFPFSENGYYKQIPEEKNSQVNFLIKINTEEFEIMNATALPFWASSVAIDSSGNVLASIWWEDNMWKWDNWDCLQTTPGAYQPKRKVSDMDNYPDCYCIKLSPDFSELKAATFFGGLLGWKEGIEKIVCDKDNNIYFAGMTVSSDFPVTEDALDKEYRNWAGDYEAHDNSFFAVMDSNMSELKYSTHIGGDYWESVYDLVLDSDGSVFVVGKTESFDIKTTDGSVLGYPYGAYIFKYMPGIGVTEQPISQVPGPAIYPNPVQAGSPINIEMGSDLAPVYHISLFDLYGRRVATQTATGTEGTCSISTTGLAPGIYIIETENGHERHCSKLVVR